MTSFQGRWIGTYSIGLTIWGKLGCPNDNNNNSKTRGENLSRRTKLGPSFQLLVLSEQVQTST
jgi:hypothetical protein